MDVAVCVITNFYLDSDYIDEFCEHYFSIGVNKIYLLDDLYNQTHMLSEIDYVNKKMNERKIIYIPMHNHPNQHGLYDNFYKEHKDEFDWCCFFDADEFLSLKKHKNICDFISDFESKADAITVSWYFFSDGGHIHKCDGSVVENYKEVSKFMKNRNKIETKVIVRGKLNDVRFFIGHCALCNSRADRTYHCDGTSYAGQSFPFPFHTTSFDVAALNHYYTKSTEDFIHRKSIGRLDIPQRGKKECLIEFKASYFEKNEWSQEKEDLFNEAISKL